MPNPHDIAPRLDRLEREIRRWRLAALAAAGLLGITALAGAAPLAPPLVADQVRARRFVLADEAGRIRAVLGTEEEGGWPGLELFDDEGRARVLLELAPDGSPRLVFADRSGTPRVVMGSARITRGGTGGAEQRPVSSLVLFGEDGRVLFSIP